MKNRGELEKNKDINNCSFECATQNQFYFPKIGKLSRVV